MLLNYGVGEDSRVPWTTRRSNQSILKEISPEYSLEGLMLKLKLQYLGHLMWRADLSEKTLIWERYKAGGEGGDRKWDGWMASLTQWTWAWARSRRWWRIGKPGVLQSMGLQRVRHDWVTEQRQQRQIIRRKVYKFIYILHGIRALIRNEDQRNGKLICSDSRLNREKHLWKSK